MYVSYQIYVLQYTHTNTKQAQRKHEEMSPSFSANTSERNTQKASEFTLQTLESPATSEGGGQAGGWLKTGKRSRWTPQPPSPSSCTAGMSPFPPRQRQGFHSGVFEQRGSRLWDTMHSRGWDPAGAESEEYTEVNIPDGNTSSPLPSLGFQATVIQA